MDLNTSNECDQIISNINKMTDTAIETIKVVQERAKAAEQTLDKVKQTLSEEINRAYKIGFNEGIKYKMSSEDNSGGTAKSNEDVAKLVLETKN